MAQRSEAGIVIGNVEAKYDTRNPLTRALMNAFLGAFDRLLAQTSTNDVHEVGCGEGHLSHHIASQGILVRGCDFSHEIIAEACARYGSESIPFAVRSIYDLDPETDRAHTVVCCEVLEHLDDPATALDRLWAITGEWCIVSVPREPLWRVLNMLRGKYFGDFGNTPGHLQHWSRGGFVRFVGRRFVPVAVASPLPWTIVLCRKRD